MNSVKYRTTKTIYFLRHGQSVYNASMQKHGVDPMHFDAPITELGKQQAAQAIHKIRRIPHELDLIAVSPLTRAIQTMLIAFQERIPKTPISVRPESRELVSGSDDLGRTPEELKQEFPLLDFTHLKKVWWYHGKSDPDHEEDDPNLSRMRFQEKYFREPKAIYKPRLEKWKQWLAQNDHKIIAVVGHADIIYQLTGESLDNCQLFGTKFDLNTQVFAPYCCQHLTLNGRQIKIEMEEWNNQFMLLIMDLETGITFKIEEPCNENFNPSSYLPALTEQFKQKWEGNNEILWDQDAREFIIK